MHVKGKEAKDFKAAVVEGLEVRSHLEKMSLVFKDLKGADDSLCLSQDVMDAAEIINELEMMGNANQMPPASHAISRHSSNSDLLLNSGTRG
jgi:hypothetical protein